MKKAMFRRNDVFFHNVQKIFVVVDDKVYIEGKGWLYNLKCFKHEGDDAKPWKRYYESRMMEELTPMKKSNAIKVLYGETVSSR